MNDANFLRILHAFPVQVTSIGQSLRTSLGFKACAWLLALWCLALAAQVPDRPKQEMRKTQATLLGHWTFDEGSGTLLSDQTSAARDGQIHGSPNWVAEGKIGGALAFDQLDDYVQIPSFSMGNRFTLAFWFKAGDVAGPEYQYLVGLDLYENAHSLNVYLPETGQGGPGLLRSVVRDADDSEVFEDASGHWSDATWHHYALVVDGFGGHIIYLDGVVHQIGTNGGDAFQPTSDWFLGARSDLEPSRFFGGALDDLRLYDGALGLRDIRKLLEIPNQPPVAAIASPTTPITVKPGELVNFDAGTSTDSDSPIARYDWDFGDGQEAEGVLADHKFQATGSYEVELVVLDEDGATASTSVTIDVVDQLPSDSPLLAHWPLDETTGTLASDSSGEGHAGTLFGNGTWTTEGRIGGALAFDEVDDYLRISDFSYGPSFSISFWFKVPDLSGSAYGYLMSHGAFGLAESLNVYLAEDGSPEAGRLRTLLLDADDSAIVVDVYENLDDDAWHHLALSVDANGGFTLFLDGEVATTGSAGGDAFNPATDLYFGARQDLDGQRFLGGSLDDIRLYDGALSATFVEGLWLANNQAPIAVVDGSGFQVSVAEVIDFDGTKSSDPDGTVSAYAWDFGDGTQSSLAQPSHAYTAPGTYQVHLTVLDEKGAGRRARSTVTVSALPSSAQLLAHWPLDETMGTTAEDVTGQGHQGSVHGVVSVADGKLGNAFRFDEVDDYVEVVDFGYGPDFSLAFWFRLPELTGSAYQYAISHGTWPNPNSLDVYFGETGVPESEITHASVRDGNDTLGISQIGEPFDDDAWHHFALTVSADGGHTVYIDGAARAMGDKGGDAIDPMTNLFFGRRADGDPDRFFGGDLDDIRIYERTLSAGDVETLFLEANLPPVVSLVSPSQGSQFTEPATLVLAAQATDSDGFVEQVSFYGDGQLLGIGTQTSGDMFEFTWENVPAGTHQLHVVAEDNLGVTTTSATTSISVVVANLDSDGDGIPDNWELQYGLNPGDPADAQQDADGDSWTNLAEYLEGTDPTDAVSQPLATALSTQPADGSVEVALTRETIFRFSRSLDASQMLNDQSVYALFAGEKLGASIHLSQDADTLTLFYDEPLPSSARVEVFLDGETITDVYGKKVDADGDGQPGGMARVAFETVNLEVVTGTSVVGRIFASEQTLLSGTTQWVNQPLQGVTIRVDGQEDTLFAVTDVMGGFRLEPCPSGTFFIHVDGSTAQNPIPPGAYYPNVGKAWRASAGVENNVGDIYLPLINSDTLQPVSQVQDTTIGFPASVLDDFPEFSDVAITVPAGSLFNNDGAPGGSVGIAPVEPERLPGTLPPGLEFPLVITVQTDGATNFDEPAPVCFPNLPDPQTGLSLAPGEKSALWSFNHDAGRWEVIGPMTVSASGTTICTDPGVGIRAPGWHGVGPGGTGGGGGPGDAPPPPTGPGGCGFAGSSSGNGPGGDDGANSSSGAGDGAGDAGAAAGSGGVAGSAGGGGGMGDPEGATVSDPVLLFSGEQYLLVPDLVIKGRGLDFNWARTYRSRVDRTSPVGHKWDHAYNVFLEKEGRLLRLHSGNGRVDTYSPRPDGTWSRAEFFASISENGDGSYTLTFADKGRWLFQAFDGSASAGKLTAIIDRNDNSLQLSYGAEGRLEQIVDTLNRPIDLAYNADGFLESVTDFAGRQIQYAYFAQGEAGGSAGDLKSVTSPAVTGTPNGNDFPAGKTTTYTYSSGFGDERLNHNLLTITDGRRNDSADATFGQGPMVVNTYSNATNPDAQDFGRVVRQVWGGDTVDFTYLVEVPGPENGGATAKTIVNDRNGQVKEFYYDARQRLVLMREYMGRADAELPTTDSENRPADKRRVDDPDYFETRYEWTVDARIRRITYPNGNLKEFVYESDVNPGADSRMRGNVRSLRYSPGTHEPAGDQPMIEKLFEYDTDFGCGCGSNFITKYTDPRGYETSYEYDANGNRVKTTHRLPSIVSDYEYNAHGQMTAHVRPANDSGHRRRDEYTYYTSGPSLGYMASAVVDADNLALTTTYEYDQVGNVTRVTDPRGNDSLYVVNALNQVVRQTSRQVDAGQNHRYQRDYYFDANDNLIQIDVQNVDENGVVGANSHFTTLIEYDILDFLTKETREVSEVHSLSVAYVYDGNRNLIQKQSGVATDGTQPTNTVDYLYDGRDLLFQEIQAQGDADQSTSQFDYDGNGNLVTEAMGLEHEPRISHFFYDGYNRQAARTDAMGNRVEIQFDANDNILAMEEFGELDDGPGGQGNIRLAATAGSYDPMDRLTQLDRFHFHAGNQADIGDGVGTTSISYSDFSQIETITNDNGHALQMHYDTANRVQTIIDPSNNERTYGYDANSNVVAIQERDRADLGSPDQVFTTTLTYDFLDRKTAVVDNAGNRRTYRYNSRNLVTETQDALRDTPSGPGNRVAFTYDAVNRLIQKEQFLTATGTGSGQVIDSVVTDWVWDDSSRLVQQTNDNGMPTTYAYDALDRLVTMTYADDTGKTVAYDVHGNVVQTIDANGSIVMQSFDLLNRLTGRNVIPGPNVSADTTFESFGYDGLSRLTTTQDNDAVVTFQFDSLSNPIGETLNGQAVSRDYDAVGNLLSCAYPGGRVIDHTYDSLERLTGLLEGGLSIAQFSYVGPDRLEQVDLGNGVQTRLTYDGITGIANPVGDAGVKQIVGTLHIRTSDNMVVDQRSYTWDGMHHKTSRSDVRSNGTDKTFAYGYDSLYRMVASTTEQSGNIIEAIDYELDGLGNRQFVNGGADGGAYQLSMGSGTSRDLEVDQYTATPFDQRTYDDNGNLRIKSGLSSVSMTYDYRNRMVAFIDELGKEHRYAYDPLGRRIGKVTDVFGAAETTYFFYSDFQVLEEQDGNNITQATYVYGSGVDEVVQMERNGVAYYYHADDMLNITALTDANGDVVERYEYGDYGQPSYFDATGSPLAASQVGNPYAFTGRRYDGESGLYYYRLRHYEPRSGRFTTTDPLGFLPGMNRRAYVNNNPFSYADPFGLAPKWGLTPAQKQKLVAGLAEAFATFFGGFNDEAAQKMKTPYVEEPVVAPDVDEDDCKDNSKKANKKKKPKRRPITDFMEDHKPPKKTHVDSPKLIGATRTSARKLSRAARSAARKGGIIMGVGTVAIGVAGDVYAGESVDWYEHATDLLPEADATSYNADQFPPGYIPPTMPWYPGYRPEDWSLPWDLPAPLDFPLNPPTPEDEGGSCVNSCGG